MNNWERKSSYLLREIVKFRTYIDVLQLAQTQKDKIYAARAAEKAEQESVDCPVEGFKETRMRSEVFV